MLSPFLRKHTDYVSTCVGVLGKDRGKSCLFFVASLASFHALSSVFTEPFLPAVSRFMGEGDGVGEGGLEKQITSFLFA